MGRLDDLAIDGFGHWLAGFIDGEGSFIIARQRDRITPRFRVKLRDDDAAILFTVQARTGIGRVHGEKVYERSSPRNGRPQMVWDVTNKADLSQLVLVLERFPLRAKKRVDFEIWKQAVRVYCTGGGSVRMLELAALRRQLIESRAYQGQEDAEPAVLQLVQSRLEGMADAG